MNGECSRIARMGTQERAVLEALLPPDAASGLPGAAEAGVPEFLERFRSEAPPAMRAALALALFSAAWLSPLLIRRLPPLSGLPPGDRERALAAMSRSRWAVARQLVLLLKATVSFRYGAHPAVRRAIGFPS
jgi:hypothetical protein